MIRAGYGVAFGRIFSGAYQWARFNAPEVIRVSLANPDLLNPLAEVRFAPGESPRTGVNLLDSNLVVPYSQHYTLELEREVVDGIRIRTAYIGSRTWKLFEKVYGNRGGRPPGIPVTTATTNLRRPDQRFYNIEHLTNMGRAYFDAGQVQVEKVKGNDFALRALYTWSKVIDTGTEFSSTAVNDDEIRSQNGDNVIQDLRAVSKFDAPHSLVVLFSQVLTRLVSSCRRISQTH